MKRLDFKTLQRESQEKWRETNISTQENGWQNGKNYSHIIPSKDWKENLWEDIRTTLPEYLEKNDVKEHTGVHNLLSSWIVCANLYFPIKYNEQLKHLFVNFLQTKISTEITEILDIQLEFAFEESSDLHPSKLLGEHGGSKGSGQTSPDVAFIVKTSSGGNGLVLCENKYTEHSFYSCSARKVNKKVDRTNNPNPERCMNSCNFDFKEICHQFVWGRQYLSLVEFSEEAKMKLKRCPAATAGYQLLRQQALAEGIAKSRDYEIVVSVVAFDERNTDLINCLSSTGINDFQINWADMFNGKAKFQTWTHQEWVQFVRNRQSSNGFVKKWLTYLQDRYQY